MDCGNLYDINFESACGLLGGRSMFVKQSVLLDDEKGQPPKDSRKLGKKSVGLEEIKTMAAMKSHSDAERRRRERINAHLDTLRSLVPNNEKMDKATLLAEVISQVKQLKTAAARASQGMHIPMDNDAVEVAIVENNVDNGSLLLKAELCCEYRPEVLSEMRQAIDSLPVHVLKCEISTLGGRMKSGFLITCEGNAVTWESVVSSVRAVLDNILEKVAASAEYDRLVFPRKRQQVS